MSEPHKWKRYWAVPASEGVLLLTLALTVLANLPVAIGVGVRLGLALRLRDSHAGPRDWNTREC